MEQLTEDEPCHFSVTCSRKAGPPEHACAPAAQSLLGLGIEQTPPNSYLIPHKYLKMENKNLYRWDDLEEEERGNGSALPLGLRALRPRTCRLSLASS